MHVLIAVVVGILVGGVGVRLYFQPALAKVKATEAAARQKLAAEIQAAQKTVAGK